MEPHVFVVMPFGLKEARAASKATKATKTSKAVRAQAAINVNFDDVYDLLIGPALKRADCVPFRADKEPGAGDIRTDMYYELVTADVVLADISILNPNVFYELGVRHGVAERGVFMIHGGWSNRPFDVAPDRTFDYDGELFVKKVKRDKAWNKKLNAEIERLGKVLRGAIEVDEQTIGSPVYGSLVGLKPANWTNIKTAKANYFGDVFADWKQRVEIARLNGWPGDILTLAGEAPTRFHHSNLLWAAADALGHMERYEAAKPVLEEVLKIQPKHRDALTRLGLVLGRLGQINEAKVHMLQTAELYKGDTEAQGILGRVYKDLWKLEWQQLETLEARQHQAVSTSTLIASAIRSYDHAVRRKFDYYNGINVVSLFKLLEHLKAATGEQPVDSKVKDIDDLVSVVRFAAQNELDCSGLDTGQAGVWAAATLGELEVVLGNTEKARTLYRDAVYAPATTYFNIGSMLDQIYLFQNLGFRLEAIEAVKKVLEQRRNALEQKIGGLKKSEPRFKRIVVASGHMIDAPDRVKKGLGKRFPPQKEGIVRERISKQLKSWKIGKGDLAICGGARGTDILFAELCADSGAEVWLFLALEEGEFLTESVRLPNSDWQDRFYNLKNRKDVVQVFWQHERLKSAPKGASVFSRNNLWMINTARVEANDPKNLYAVLVWDEKPTGDGPGGTSDFAARIKELGGHLAPIINPTKL